MTHFQFTCSGSRTETISFSKPTRVIHPCTSSRSATSGRFVWVCIFEHLAWRLPTELFGSGLAAMLSTIDSLALVAKAKHQWHQWDHINGVRSTNVAP